MAPVDDLRILNLLNGHVLTGDVLLQQLQDTVESRISSANHKFLNLYELGAFSQNHSPSRTSKAVLMGRLDITFDVLEAMAPNPPKALHIAHER